MAYLFKSFLSLAIALASLGLCAQTDAEQTQHHPEATPAKATKAVSQKTSAKESMTAMDSKMKVMQEMHDKMMKAKTPEERNALMADHMKAMMGAMSMMGGMGAAGKDAMKDSMPADPVARQQMMEKRMDMMESMMMMDRMPTAHSK